MEIRGIVFDLSDTLVWIDPDRRMEGCEKAARCMGVDSGRLLDALERTLWGRAWCKSPEVIDILSSCRDYMGVSVNPGDMERGAHQLREALLDSVNTYPGVEPMLEKLVRKNCRLWVSGDNQPGVAEAFSRMPLAKFFNPASLSRHAGDEPGTFRHLLREMELEPGMCIYVGWGDPLKMEEARREGMITVAVSQPRQFLRDDDIGDSDYVMDSILHVPLVLDEIKSPSHGVLEDEQVLALWQELCRLDPFTARHCRRVSSLMASFAQGMSWAQQDVRLARMAGLLHDLGKIHMSSDMFKKIQSGQRINTEEIVLMKTHTALWEKLSAMGVPAPAVEGVRHHHERFDGSGYPDRLRGEEIPLMVRMLTIADFYDSIVTQRPCKTPPKQKPLNYQDGMKLLVEESHTRLDPELVRKFIPVVNGSF